MHTAARPVGLAVLNRHSCSTATGAGLRTAPLHRPMPQLRGVAPRQRRQVTAGGVAANEPAPTSASDAASPQPDVSATPGATAPGSRSKAVVVGAGPAGCTAACYLARQGYDVTVLERRADPSGDAVTKSTFIMALMPRGTDAIRELGIKLPEDGWLNGLAPAKGAAVHALDGKTTVRPHHRGNVFAERNALARHLLLEARRLQPSIDFRFDTSISGFDLHSKKVSLASGGELQYDLLVAADGAGSQVREAVAASEPKFSSSRTVCDQEYFVIRNLPPMPSVEPTDDRPDEPGQYVHMFAAKPTDGTKQPVMGFGAYVHEDGSYSAAMQLNAGWRPPHDVAAVEAQLNDALPHVPQEWLAVAAKQVAGQTPRSWGSTISCSHLAVPWAGVALVGDAGHGVTPNLGQGCNAALESVAVLDRVLSVNAERGKDLAFALSEFNRVRKPDMDALRYLDSISTRIWGNTIGSGKRSSPFEINWPFLGTLANIWVSGFLHNIMPRIWAAPAMLNGFTRRTTEYSYIVWCRRRDLAILTCAVIAVLALGVEGIGLLINA